MPQTCTETEDERLLRHARERLSRPGAWLDGGDGRYRVIVAPTAGVGRC